jgi:hypothetical protein
MNTPTSNDQLDALQDHYKARMNAMALAGCYGWTQAALDAAEFTKEAVALYEKSKLEPVDPNVL